MSVLTVKAPGLTVANSKKFSSAREVEQEWEEERAQYTRPRREYDDDDDYERRYDRDRPHRKKRWTEIFDIFD